MAMRLFTERTGVVMAASERDDGEQRKRPDGIKRLNRMRERENTNIETHEREPNRAKVTYSTTHRDMEYRLDSAKEVAALRETKRRVPTMKYLAFIACNFGMIVDDRGIFRVHPAKLEPKERNPSYDEVATYYRLSYATVRVYDREVRRVFEEERDHAERTRPNDDDFCDPS